MVLPGPAPGPEVAGELEAASEQQVGAEEQELLQGKGTWICQHLGPFRVGMFN